nr:unnamed protein product [Callosobruchus chinensis]
MYSIQKSGRNVNTNGQEIRKLVALHILMVDEEIVLDVEHLGEIDEQENEDDDDNIPLSVLAKRLQPKSKKSKKNVTWAKNPFSPSHIVFNQRQYDYENDENKTPLMYFSK